MWMRRTAAVQTGPVNGQQQPSEVHFNPNHRRYRTCCCHCKTFTLGFGVVELFLICFVLVAVAPDFNSRICSFRSPQDVEHGPEQPQQQTMAPEQVVTTQTTPSSTSTANMAITTTVPNGTGNQFMAQKKRRRRRREAIDTNLAKAQQGQQQISEVLGILTQKPLPSEAQTSGTTMTMTTLMTTTTTSPVSPASPVSASQNGSASEHDPAQQGFSTTRLLRQVTCSLTVVWLGWAIVQMFSIALMCYGVKKLRWQLLLLHIFLRICCVLAIWLVIAALIGALIHPVETRGSAAGGHIVMCIFLFLIFLWLCLLLKSELRCCEFVKRSAETGFSISNTRPIGPSTLSQHSDSARARGGSAQVRRLVQSGIRKMPATGPSAKRYQTQQQQQQEQLGGDENEGSNEMTMSTLGTGAGPGAQTRPSTAGSLALAKQQNGTGRREGGSGREEPALDDLGRMPSNETDFGGTPRSPGAGRAAGAALPPLRHTHKMAG